jgi:hypothetical protein
LRKRKESKAMATEKEEKHKPGKIPLSYLQVFVIIFFLREEN